MTATAVEPSRAQIKLSEIVFDEGLYPRVDGHDPATVQTYARDMEQIEAAGKLISINADGILLDGRHRMLAYKTNADGGDPVVTVYRFALMMFDIHPDNFERNPYRRHHKSRTIERMVMQPLNFPAWEVVTQRS